MDRAKFKEALNGCTSEQRIALLYLEEKIIDTRANYMKNTRAELIYNQMADTTKRVITIKKDLNKFIQNMNVIEQTKIREDLVNEFKKYSDGVNEAISYQMAELEKRYSDIIKYDNMLVSNMSKQLTIIAESLIELGLDITTIPNMTIGEYKKQTQKE